MVSIQRAEQIIIPETRSQGYKRWVERGVEILRKELTFQGPLYTSEVGITYSSLFRRLSFFNSSFYGF